MAKMNISQSATKDIEGARTIKEMTNKAYYTASIKADKEIENNNKNYTQVYKRASQCSVR